MWQMLFQISYGERDMPINRQAFHSQNAGTKTLIVNQF